LTYSQFANFIELEVVLHVISRKRLLEAASEHGDLFEPLDHWYRAAKQASWRSIEDVRQMFPSADAVGRHTVFNVRGNRYRLIAEINYLANRIYIRHVVTHAEYDKGAWKR
jgi:mRNA interferase HigB